MMNRICIVGSIIIIAIMIAIPTYFNVKKNHEDKLVLVTRMEITSAAKKCFLDSICTGNETTLKYLYEKNYLKKQVDPKTKEYIDENNKILFQNKKVVVDFI